MISDKKRKWRRINGLSLPLDGFQIIAWIFTLLFTLVYFGAIVQSFPNEQCQLVLIILMAILLFIHIFLHISCNFVDPADPAVRAKKQIQPLPNFNRKKHLRVIENQFCNICEVKVGSKSKHCSSCNKCIDGFDHHCKWLNNCVGKRNYKLFLSCISTALACILLVLVASIICVIRAVKKTSWMCSVQQGYIFMQAIFYFAETISTNATNINQDIANSSSIVNIHYVILVPVTKNLWLAVIIITLVLTVIALGLLIHLLGFHLVLICKGFSTYEYIMQHRNSDEERNSGSLATSVAKKCSISPHKPSSLENSNPSLHRSKPITM
ncbi:putative palmitoyltransferase ZDHHC11 [Nymphon striatum]|nr:putative palmitoyltransferase ZDHHC11 [Nymphon striatum]